MNRGQTARPRRHGGNLCDLDQVAKAVGNISIVQGSSYAAYSGMLVVAIVRTTPSVADMDGGLVDSASIQALDTALRQLPLDEQQAKLRRCFQGREVDPQRFPDVTMHKWILDTNREAFQRPLKLDKESILDSARKLKITTKLVCLMRSELDGARQSCSQVRSYFEDVAKKYKNILLDAASSFSKEKWTGDNIVEMLAIFDTLIDAIVNIVITIEDRTAPFHNIRNAFKSLLEQTAGGKHIREESDIHPSTRFLIQALEFFHHNKMHTVTGDAEAVFHKSWSDSLERDARTMFKGEHDRQYMFIFKNTYSVLEMKYWPPSGRFLSDEEQGRLHQLIDKYIDIYCGEYWHPISQKYYRGKQSFPSLKGFNKDFGSICDRQRKWTVPVEIRDKLRQKIIAEDGEGNNEGKLIIPSYRRLFNAVNHQAGGGKSSMSFLRGSAPKNKIRSVEVMIEEIQALFQS
ncbi:hypothetical protein BS78_06G009800 [Paspalum vaginatum]|nr:hypothetical protein BS78_06G009800 [Paspalum vaginatum]